MGYVAVKGGTEAIENAIKFLEFTRLKGKSKLIKVEQILEQLWFAVDKVMSEGSLYAPKLAALAIKQSAGDLFEAAFILRAFRTTLSRVGYSIALSTTEMKIIRRISAAFKDIPRGQILGPSSDYTLRLLNFELLRESEFSKSHFIKEILKETFNSDTYLPDSFPKIVDLLRKENLLINKLDENKNSANPFDITRESITFPAPRSARLQAMARGETGGLLLLAYSNMRGYGDIHPTIGELRVGYLPVKINDPYNNKVKYIGEVKITEAEVISKFTAKDGSPKFTLGYGICFGHNETKAISMAVLDRAMQAEEPKMVSEDEEFVLSHIDGIESMGFCNHYKLPHYVTFQSDLDRLRKAQENLFDKNRRT